MKPKTMILMVVAIVCGLGASYMTSRLLAEREDQPQQQAPVEIPKVKILVAKTNLDHGAAIKNPLDMFVEKTMVQDDAPKEGLTDTKILKGKYLKRSLRKGDVVTVDDLVDERTSILANMPDGFQAYGIQVDPASIAGGWASLPGSKVNILWTMRRNDDKSTFSRLLLEDVLVLAADGNSKGEEGKAMAASVVIVALKTRDTLKVKLAQSYGPLTLTLRKLGDAAPTIKSESFTGAELFTSKLDKDKKKPLSTGNEKDPEGLDPEGLDNVPKLPTTKPDEIKVADVPPPAPKKYYHTVNFRQGDRQWKQVIEVDAKGNPIQEDSEGPMQPPPAFEANPQQGPNTPPEGNNDNKKGPNKGPK